MEKSKETEDMRKRNVPQFPLTIRMLRKYMYLYIRRERMSDIKIDLCSSAVNFEILTVGAMIRLFCR